jgi:uncharacterized protein YndB with AHSA1/START domain
MGVEISRLNVRRSGYIRASAERVWAEFESFERICAWFNLGHTIHRFEPEPGGEVLMSVDLDGVTHCFGGTIIAFEPQREITFTSQWQGELAWLLPTLWTIRLTRCYDGTQVEIFHHGFERLGDAAGDQLESYEAGWDNKHLRRLRQIVES